MYNVQTMMSPGERQRWCQWVPHLLQILCQVNANPDPAQACVQSSPAMNCRHLSLYSVPTNLSDRIQKLDLSHNFIQNLTHASMSKLHNLERLDLHDNHLEILQPGALNALPSLQSLNLASNRLNKRSASHKGIFDCLRSLKTLNLAKNNLDGEAVLCYLSNITSLVHVDLSRNAIVVLSSGMFDGAPQLSELDLSNNFIDEIESSTFDSLKDLRVLNLAANSIRCISDFDLPQLYFLNLSSNIIEFFLTDEAQESYQLISLDLSHNNLVHFPVLTKFQMVKHINLSGNDITELVPSSDVTEERIETWSWYEATRTGQDLSCAIENSLSQLLNVTDLNLSDNNLVAFPWYYLSKMSKLNYLSLAGNCLKSLTDDSSGKVPDSITSSRNLNITLQSLKVMDLQANSIHVMPQWIFHFLPEIEHINVKSNKIRFCSNLSTGDDRSAINQQDCSTFSGARNLRYLNLQKNNITHLPPRLFDRTPLVSLDLSHNPTLDLQGKALEDLSQSLQVLSVHGNGMNNSQMNLPCLQSVKSLDLSNNQLTRIPRGLKCSSMESLDLRNNSLKTLKEMTTFLRKENLKSVSISGNPLDCCSLTWLDLLLAAKIHIWDLAEAYCVYAETESIVSVNDPHHNDHCHHPTDETYLKIGVIVLSGSFTLLLLICYVHKKRGRKFCMTYGIRSTKVAPETPDPTKSFNADRKQVCFTVSINGLD